MLLPSLLSPDQVRDRLRAAPDRVLAVVEFGEQPQFRSRDRYVHVHVPLRSAGEREAVELWPAQGVVSRAVSGGVEVSHDGVLLFGTIVLRGVAAGAGFEDRISAAYGAITDACGALGYPHPLRIWNFIPGIHEIHAGLDRYQFFCRARHEPLERYLKSVGDGFPAATVVGTRGGEGALYFLAAKQPGQHLENPRQLPAPEYPDTYGPRSPSFSRATLARSRGESILYISGTASIVGHESRHPFDAAVQTGEILRNLEELIRVAARTSRLTFRGLRDLKLVRVFLRESGDVPAVSAVLKSALTGAIAVFYHEGDLCRRELMIEIEGIAVPGATDELEKSP